MFWTTVGLFPFLVAVSWTDVRRQTIPNAVIYPGMACGVLLNLLLREEGLPDSLLGLAVCGFLGVACFVFFPDLGGGDVKLLAFLGAGLGFRDGFEAMLWTFVLGMMLAIALLIWQNGIWTLLRKLGRRTWHMMRGGRGVPLKDEDRAMLTQPLFLAPAALAAVVIVRWNVLLAGP